VSKKSRRPRLDTSMIGKDDQVIVCSSTSSGRAVLSAVVEVRCAVCSAPCWLSKGNLQVAIFAKSVCMDCAVVLARKHGLPHGVIVPEGSRQDLRALGLTDEQIDSTLTELAEGILTDRLRLRTPLELASLMNPDIPRRKSS
jgi:hypothetical protein